MGAAREGSAPDAAARLVPAGALLYAHVSTRPGAAEDERLVGLAARFPSLRAGLSHLAAGFTPAAAALRFDRDVRPWLGDEAGLALLDAGGGRTQPLLLAAVRDRPKADAFLRRLGAAPAGSYRGTALRRLKPGTTAAFADGFLIAGADALVRDAIDRAAGAGGQPLADGGAYRRAADAADGAAGAHAFATAAGLRRLVGGRGGLAGFAAGLLTAPGTEAVDARLSAEDGGVRVRSRILRAPDAPRGQVFTPTLAARVPAGTAGFAELPGLEAVLGLASRAGGTAALEAVRAALPQVAGLQLEDIVALMASDAAITVSPGPVAPVFTLTARTRDEAASREQLARLQAPLSERLAGGAAFEHTRAGPTTTYSLPVTPELQPSYAVAGGTVVASTAKAGLEQLAPARAPVTGSRAMKEVAPAEDAKVEALGYFDPRQLLALGERTGLRVPGSPAVRDDLGRIRSAGAVVEEDKSHPTDTTAELFLEIP